MTPDEHYREAERLIEVWAEVESDDALDQDYYGNLLAVAQVHATLATLGKRVES